MKIRAFTVHEVEHDKLAEELNALSDNGWTPMSVQMSRWDYRKDGMKRDGTVLAWTVIAYQEDEFPPLWNEADIHEARQLMRLEA